LPEPRKQRTRDRSPEALVDIAKSDRRGGVQAPAVDLRFQQVPVHALVDGCGDVRKPVAALVRVERAMADRDGHRVGRRRHMDGHTPKAAFQSAAPYGCVIRPWVVIMRLIGPMKRSAMQVEVAEPPAYEIDPDRIRQTASMIDHGA